MPLLTASNVTLAPAVSSINLSKSWSLDIVVVKPTFEATFSSGWRVDATLPPIKFESAWARRWNLDVKLPKATFEAAFTARIDWNLDVTLPVVQIGAFFYALDTTGDDNIAFVLNPSNLAHAEYTNYGFTSFCKFNDEYLGCDTSGISRLSGDDDDSLPINSRVLFGTVDDGRSVLSRVDSAYFNLRHNGSINALMKYNEQEEDIYEMDFVPSVDPEGIHTRRAKFSRGVEGRNLQAGFENVSGADFEITEIEVVTVTLSRHG